MTSNKEENTVVVTNENKEQDKDGNSSSESEDSDLEVNPLFEGLSALEKNKCQQIGKEMEKNYEEVVKNENINQILAIKNAFKLNLGKIIDDETASFIYDFGENTKILNINDRIATEGAFFLDRIKEMMIEKKEVENKGNKWDWSIYNNQDIIESSSEDDDEDNDEEWTLNKPKKKRYVRKTNNNNNNNNNNGNENTSENVKPGYNQDGSKRCERLLLNDALKDTTNFAGWSKARINAYKARKEKPNAYYYRFNDVGEAQKNGGWSNDDHRLFMERVLEFGVNVQWGVFSKKIPGRVGYQCSNYWRKLVEDGKVIDPNYIVNNGKIVKHGFKRKMQNDDTISESFRRYAFTVINDPSKTFKPNDTHPKRPPNVDKIDQETTKKWNEINSGNNNNNNNNGGNNTKLTGKKRKTSVKKSGKKKRRRKSKDNDEDYNGGKNMNNMIIDEDEKPLLPNFLDAMTGIQIVKPAISPYNHVLGYDSWCRILRSEKSKNTCPFTKKKLTRRQLIKLNESNIDEYKDKIINVTQSDLKD